MAAIVFFCFFYVSIIFNPQEVADNMRKYGGFIPGIRSGKPTEEHINQILTRITMVGALYLALISVIPDFLIAGVKLHHVPLIGNWADASLPRWFLDGLNVNFYFGGTSLLIVVVVLMDFMGQVQAHLMSHQYESLMKKANLRGGGGHRGLLR